MPLFDLWKPSIPISISLNYAKLLCKYFCPKTVWEPSKWNDHGTVQYNNNCYNYASNLRTNTFAQPGRAHGAMYTSLTCSSVMSGALADGYVLKSSGAAVVHPGCTGKCCSPTALVVAPGYDFHWYRLDSRGLWSHKPGSTEARDTDNSGNLIPDPRTANRGPYTDFCGCFCKCTCDVDIN
jgi:hypothetical protein